MKIRVLPAHVEHGRRTVVENPICIAISEAVGGRPVLGLTDGHGVWRGNEAFTHPFIIAQHPIFFFFAEEGERYLLPHSAVNELRAYLLSGTVPPNTCFSIPGLKGYTSRIRERLSELGSLEVIPQGAMFLAMFTEPYLQNFCGFGTSEEHALLQLWHALYRDISVSKDFDIGHRIAFSWNYAASQWETMPEGTPLHNHLKHRAHARHVAELAHLEEGTRAYLCGVRIGLPG